MSAQSSVEATGDDSGSNPQNPEKAKRLRSPLWRAAAAFTATLVFAAIAVGLFFLSKPVGNPFWAESGSILPPIFSRGHEPAYARHDYLPIGARGQLFHHRQIESWSSENSPIKNLARNDGDNPWRIKRNGQADVVIRRLHLSADRKKIGVIGAQGQVYFYAKGKWQLLNTQVRGAFKNAVESSRLMGHEGPVLHTEFSPDGTRIITASRDGTARLWDTGSGMEIANLKGHSDSVGRAIFSPDGTHIITTSQDGTARLWDTESGRDIATLKGHDDNVSYAAFSPDGTLIVTASEDKTARVWDTKSGSEVAVIKSHEKALVHTAFSPDGTRFVTTSWDNTARLWDSTTTRQLAILRGHETAIVHAAFSPDGTRIVTASLDGTARLWDTSTGAMLGEPMRHADQVSTAAFSPDGTRIITTSLDKTARLWDARTTREILILKGHEFAVVHAAFSPDGTRIITASLDNTARLWDANNGQTTASFGSQKGINHAVFSPDGTRIITASDDGIARLWDLKFVNDQTVRVTALDAASGLIFGEQRIQYVENGQLRTRPSIFNVPVHAVQEHSNNGVRIAVGDEGAIYIGEPVTESVSKLTVVPASTNEALVNTPEKDGEPSQNPSDDGVTLGRAAGIVWRSVVGPKPGQSALRAVHFSGQVGIAVGDNGTIKISHDGGLTWRQGTIGDDHNPNLSDVRLGEGGYAVAIGRPSFDGAPFHGVLYKTDALPAVNSEGVGVWRHVPWEAGAPIASYVAIVLALCAFLTGLYFLRFWWVTRGEREGPVAAGKSDREIGWGDDDALGLKLLAMQISKFLRNAQTEPPLVLGVAGGWGSGKSSLMNLLCQDLQRRGTSAIQFNAWHHQNEDHLLAALFEAVRTRAVPSIWSMRGLWFRARLIGPRLWGHFLRVLPLLILVAIAVTATAMMISGKQIILLKQTTDEFLKSLRTDSGPSLTGYFVGALPAFGLFFWLRSLWVALPAKPAKLLKDFTSFTRMTDFSDKLSFRYNFGRAFGEVCKALRMPGVPGLVIFIDDLDRCQAKSVLSIFEAVNYFVSVGDCIVVMGFDRAQVEHSIGEELKAVADGIPDRELPLNFGNGESDKRRAYARHYMEKLINLEVAIPSMTPEAAAALAQAGESKAIKLRDLDDLWLFSLRPRISQVLRGAALFARLLTVAGVGWAFWQYGGELYQKVVGVELNQLKHTDQSGTEFGEAAAVINAQQTEAVEIETPSAAALEAKSASNQALAPLELPPTSISAQWNYEELWVLLPLITIFAVVALWMYLRRAYTISKNVEHDPKTFVEALRQANMVIEGVNPTPRAIKRFMNRMRFASTRMRRIHYRLGLLDWIAKRVGWVTDEFENQAEGMPPINDRQVIALGTAEVFLQTLPDPDSNHPEPHKLIDDYLEEVVHRRDVSDIGNNIKRLLKLANVGKSEMQTYARTLHSYQSAAPKDEDKNSNSLGKA